ncbi:hypothetical protein [Sinorhizobium meliloti]|uniref:hypothetical protein n=1 Tax=Rhizobium meliloti TaxID=382 RepID=UPI000411C68C|nr:hypothetical protein [Sinorhizobium meliloti]
MTADNVIRIPVTPDHRWWRFLLRNCAGHVWACEENIRQIARHDLVLRRHAKAQDVEAMRDRFQWLGFRDRLPFSLIAAAIDEAMQ